MFKNKFIFLTTCLSILVCSQSLIAMYAENPKVSINEYSTTGTILLSQFANPSRPVSRYHVIQYPKKIHLLCNVFEGTCKYSIKINQTSLTDEFILRIYYADGTTETKKIIIMKGEEKA